MNSEIFESNRPQRLESLDEAFFEGNYKELLSALSIETDVITLRELSHSARDYMFSQVSLACLYSRAILPAFEVKAINERGPRHSLSTSTGNESGNLLLTVTKLWQHLYSVLKQECENPNDFAQQAELRLKNILMQRESLGSYYFFVGSYENKDGRGSNRKFSAIAMKGIGKIIHDCDECNLENTMQRHASSYKDWTLEYPFEVVMASFLSYMDWYTAILSVNFPIKEDIVLWAIEETIRRSDFSSWLHCAEYQEQLATEQDRINRRILEDDSSALIKQLLKELDQGHKEDIKNKLLRKISFNIHQKILDASASISEKYFSCNEILVRLPLNVEKRCGDNTLEIAFDLEFYDKLSNAGLKNEFYQSVIDAIEQKNSSLSLTGQETIGKNDINRWLKGVDSWLRFGKGNKSSLKCIIEIFPEITKKYSRPLIISHILKFDIETLPEIVDINLFEDFPKSVPNSADIIRNLKGPKGKGVDLSLLGDFLTKYFMLFLNNDYIETFLKEYPSTGTAVEKEKWYKSQYRSSILKKFFNDEKKIGSIFEIFYQNSIESDSEYAIDGHYFPIESGYLLPLWFKGKEALPPETDTTVSRRSSENVIPGDFNSKG